MPSSIMACTMGNDCSTAVIVTENRADAVTTPPVARPPLTIFPAVLNKPEPEALLAISSLLDQEGGALVRTVLATASFCCSLASAGEIATTSPEKPAEVASASLISF